jgi:hypothetical protein
MKRRAMGSVQNIAGGFSSAAKRSRICGPGVKIGPATTSSKRTNAMRNWTAILVVVVFLALSSSFAVEGPKKSKGVFASLHTGQNVSLKDEGTAFSISFFDDDMLQSHKVVEVADDHVVVRDLNDLIETTVPVYAVKSISKMKIKLK